MHVFQLGPYPPPEGGVSRNLIAIREELLRCGHECSVAVITRSTVIRPECGVYHPSSPLALIRLLLKLDYNILHLHIGGEVSPRVLGLIAVCGTLSKGRNVLTLHSGGYAVQQIETAKRLSIPGTVFRLF